MDMARIESKALEKVFIQYDLDGDGELQIEEFIPMMAVSAPFVKDKKRSLRNLY
jgi:Ca2+-binding EF-hand superfamily protein